MTVKKWEAKHLSAKALTEFKSICQEDYGLSFENETVEDKAKEFLEFFAMIYKPFQIETGGSPTNQSLSIKFEVK